MAMMIQSIGCSVTRALSARAGRLAKPSGYRSQLRYGQAAVDVEHGAGGVRDIAAQQCRHGAADIVWCAPAGVGDETLGNALIVLVLDRSGHVGRYDPGANFV